MARRKKMGHTTPDSECDKRFPDEERRKACKMGVGFVRASSAGSSLGKPPKVRIIRER